MTKDLGTARLGQPAHDFTLDNVRWKPGRLGERQGTVVLLLVYPANETLMCTK